MGFCSELGSGSQNVNGVKEEDKVKDENYVKEGVDVNDKNFLITSLICHKEFEVS